LTSFRQRQLGKIIAGEGRLRELAALVSAGGEHGPEHLIQTRPLPSPLGGSMNALLFHPEFPHICISFNPALCLLGKRSAKG
jgi:hypothetical protein